MKHMLVIILALMCMPVHAWFEHGRAVAAADKGDWQRANSLLNTTLINNPHDPCVVYDAGVAAYKVGDHKQALAYFTHVTQMPTASDALKERALFNAGNTQVKLKQLQEAITCYEQALQIDAHDKHAQHNLEIVKKMLQEQENKKDEDKQDEQKSDEQEKQDGDQEQPSCAEAPAGKEQESKKPEETLGKDKQADKQKKQSSCAKAPADKKEQNAAADDKKSQEQLNTRLDKQLIQVLEQQEKHDAQVNKQMIKETVGSHMGGTHGKQGW